MEENDKTNISIEILMRLGAIKAKPTKNQIMIKCLNPSHIDHHASMSVSLSKGVCNCFACGYAKSLSSVYYEKTGTSIYKDLNIENPTGHLSFAHRFKPNLASYEDIPNIDFTFDGSLTSIRDSESALKWASSRGFTPMFCDNNDIKFSSSFSTYQTSDPTNKEEMSFFYNCVVIPIFEKNRLISFEARDTMGKEAWKQRMIKKGITNFDEKSYKKVLYPKHSSINTLFQYEKLDTNKPLYITEGLMDMFSLRTSEVFKNSSCLFHCNPTERQIYLLKKFPKIIYIVDNDIPGWRACLKLLEAIPGKVEFLRPPERPGIKDINDILQGKDSVLHTVQDLVDLGWLKKVSDDKSILELLIKEKTKSLK